MKTMKWKISTMGISAIFYERQKTSFILLLLAIVCIVVNIIITVGNFGLHSYNL